MEMDKVGNIGVMKTGEFMIGGKEDLPSIWARNV
jgi:hypothetical protein